jgi:hypothetical protein
MALGSDRKTIKTGFRARERVCDLNYPRKRLALNKLKNFLIRNNKLFWPKIKNKNTLHKGFVQLNNAGRYEWPPCIKEMNIINS